jgi:hypothetical protein
VVYLTILGGRGRRIDEQVARDLRIHELLGDILGKRNDDFLRSLYLEPLDNEEVAMFRLNVFRDLLKGEVLDAVAEFVERVMRITGTPTGLGRAYTAVVGKYLHNRRRAYRKPSNFLLRLMTESFFNGGEQVRRRCGVS